MFFGIDFGGAMDIGAFFQQFSQRVLPGYYNTAWSPAQRKAFFCQKTGRNPAALCRYRCGINVQYWENTMAGARDKRRDGMLRGLNKNVVVVRDTGSDLFEEAIFIVKPQAAASSATLVEEAKKIVEAAAGTPPRKKRWAKK
ncbi:MAG TPA: hypothetical protein VN446_02155 [Candidatus Acidoferrum sp.]|nr:hypothetical protein [Candidatus Acidoferrum sp.]